MDEKKPPILGLSAIVLRVYAWLGIVLRVPGHSVHCSPKGFVSFILDIFRSIIDLTVLAYWMWLEAKNSTASFGMNS